jgi:hypothetical protein
VKGSGDRGIRVDDILVDIYLLNVLKEIGEILTKMFRKDTLRY